MSKLVNTKSDGVFGVLDTNFNFGVIFQRLWSTLTKQPIHRCK